MKVDTQAKEAEVHSALIIEPVSTDDSGTYTATAKNVCGEVTTSSNVTVSSKSCVLFLVGCLLVVLYFLYIKSAFCRIFLRYQ